MSALPLLGCGSSSDTAGSAPPAGGSVGSGTGGALGSGGFAGSGGSALPAAGGAAAGASSAGDTSGGSSNAGAANGGSENGGAATGGAAGTGGQGGAGLIDPGPCKPRPVSQAGDVVFYCSGVAQWEIYDKAAYTKYKANFDEIIKLLDQGYAAIIKRTGPTTLKLPIQVVIEQDTCCGGWAAGATVGYKDGDFQDDTGMDWIRGVVLGEVVNAVTGTYSDNWPSDWWVNSVWYFPGFIAVDVLREVSGPERSLKWETDEKYRTYPIYNLFVSLKNEKTFSLYQTFFASVTKDQMAWAQIGANPSAIKTNYVIAYMSMAYGMNLGDRFLMTGKAPGTNTVTIQAIMDAHAKLVSADAQGKATTSNWSKFRKGDYAGAAAGL